jgi:quinohemoprotein ethanol dehydrogenase
LLVYKLGGVATHPIEPIVLKMSEPPPAVTGSSESVAHGEGLYVEHCARCHGPAVGKGGAVKDLRYMNQATHQVFAEIVLGGIYSGIGMVSFSDVLSTEDAEDVHNYLITAANKTWHEDSAEGWWQDLLAGAYDLIATIMVWFLEAPTD